jgi:hypothetical protein
MKTTLEISVLPTTTDNHHSYTVQGAITRNGDVVATDTANVAGN